TRRVQPIAAVFGQVALGAGPAQRQGGPSATRIDRDNGEQPPTEEERYDPGWVTAANSGQQHELTLTVPAHAQSCVRHSAPQVRAVKYEPQAKRWRWHPQDRGERGLSLGWFAAGMAGRHAVVAGQHV